MNKLTIPALLLGVVMVAGAFAFMPVQEASTVHTTGTAQGTASVTTTFTSASTGDIIFTCGADSGCVVQEIYLTSDGSSTFTLTDLVWTSDGKTLNLDSTVTNLAATGITALVRGLTDADAQGDPIVLGSGDTLTLTATATGNGVVKITTVSSGVVSVNTAGVQ